LVFAGLLEGREDEGVDAEEKEELGFARVGLDLMRGLVHFEFVLPFFTSNPAPFSGTFSFLYFLSLLIKMLPQLVIFLTACPAPSSGLAVVTDGESFPKLVKLCCLFWAKTKPGFSHFLILIFSCLALGGLLISASADLLFQKPIRLLVRDIFVAALSLYGVSLTMLSLSLCFTYTDS